MLGNNAPYHVRMLRLISADAGAVTVTVSPYCAGDGAVIWYCEPLMDACAEAIATYYGRGAGLASRSLAGLAKLFGGHVQT